jgi:hypothetical protein
MDDAERHGEVRVVLGFNEGNVMAVPVNGDTRLERKAGLGKCT